MIARRTVALATLLVAGGLAAGGCASSAPQASAAAHPAAEQAATLREGRDGGPGTVHLSAEARQRLDIRTTAVAANGGALVLPYGAVVYEPDGSSWAYVEIEERTYQRQPLTIASIRGEQVTLSSGPAAGTPVVSQGAAELVGVEARIDGEQ